MKAALTSLLFISFFSFGQKDLQSINLSDSGSKINIEYLKQLDTIFTNSRIIGLGESTHGTSEFTSIRADIFKHLVENHNYTVFFLEADYNACSRVNRYIHGAEDDGKEAFLEVRLWPWQTQELLDFVEWMRVYNLQHNNVLEFVGCDMQLIKDDKQELPRLFSMDSKFQKIAPKLPSLDFDTKDSALMLLKQKEWNVFSAGFFQNFPNEEPLLIKSVTQWFEDAVSTGYKRNFRDSCMGNNIADYLARNPTRKGIYFAHNGHVAKISVQFEQDQPVFKRAGHFLDERLGNSYFAIALEFNSGSFNAINFFKDGDSSKYIMEYFTIKKRKKNSIAHIVLGKEDKIKYVSSTLIPNKRNIKYNSIGAVYGRGLTGKKIYRFRRFEKEHYNGVILIKKGTPTHLLTRTSRKNEKI